VQVIVGSCVILCCLSDALACKGSVAAVEALFQTELHNFKHAENGRNVILYTGSLTLPKSVEGIVSFVEGFSRFPTPHKIAKRQVAAGTDYVITPEGLDSLLSLNGAKGTGAVIQSVAEFQSEPAYTPNELGKTWFCTRACGDFTVSLRFTFPVTFSKETSVPTITVAKKIGPFSPGGDPESSLDIQYISSVGQGNTNWFYTQADWLYSFAVQFNNISTPPDVVSMSYGWYEGDQCSIETDPSICKTSYGYVERVNTEFQKLGARGVTVGRCSLCLLCHAGVPCDFLCPCVLQLLASSGDSGAHGRTDVDCQYKVLRPAFPAASPFVTAVGATMIKIGEGAVGGKCPVCTKGSYAKQVRLASPCGRVLWEGSHALCV
jgi:subtilase family serine protease